MSTFDDVVTAAKKGPAALDAWFAAHPSEATRKLADALDRAAHEELDKRHVDLSAVRSIAAAQTYWRLGADADALRTTSNYLEAAYIMASSEIAYSHVRSGCEATAARARELGHSQVAFLTTVLGADCAYWIADGLEEPSQKSKWLQTSLQDLKRAAAEVISVEGPHLMRYASLAVAVFLASDNLNLITEGSPVEPLVLALATATERLIPVDLVFPNDPAKTKYAAAHLGRLSNEFGNPQLGARRLAFLAKFHA